MIPKTVHQIWIGEKPIHEALVRYAMSWNAYHPDWVVTLWTDRPDLHNGPAWSEIRQLPPLINAHVLEELAPLMKCRNCSVAALSDLYRYEILAQFGGVYADLDVEVFRRIDGLLKGVSLGCADEWGPRPGNYLIAAEANHPTMWSVVREVLGNIRFLRSKNRTADGGFKKVNPVLVTGPVYLQHYTQRDPGALVWPWPIFNPLPAGYNPEQVEHWPDSAWGNHAFFGSWYKRKYRRPPPPFCAPAEPVEEFAA
jgi:hypothetical protein